MEQLGHPEKHHVNHSPEHHVEHVPKEHVEKAHSPEKSHHDVEKLRADIEKHAVESKQLKESHVEHEKPPVHSHHHASKELKLHGLQRTLTSVRKDLRPSERALSKVVHQPVVDSVSEFGAKTFARPSGVIGGGLLGLLGTSTLLWMSKHYGFEYNYLMATMLFVAGFFVGLLIEAVVRLLTKKKHKHAHP